MARLFWCLIFVGSPLLLGTQARSRAGTAHSRAPAALVCQAGVGSTVGASASVTVIGGVLADGRWVDSEEAKGLMHKGDRLSLYALETGELGELTLTSDGELGDPDEPPYTYGLSFDGQVRVPAAREAIWQRAVALRKRHWVLDMVALWHSQGAKAPRWVKADLLSMARRSDVPRVEAKPESAYWRVAADWLAGRGYDSAAIGKLCLHQVVRADVDGDARWEVFLSFGSIPCGHNQPDGGSKDAGHGTEYYSYLLMRRLLPGSSRVRTTILDERSWGRTIVAGLCDLDRDGRAEIITQHYGIDDAGADLYRWVDGQPKQVGMGWISGP